MSEEEIKFPMKSRMDIMDAHPEHYGKYVVVKGFNDNTIVAYGDTWRDADADAKSKGYKTVGHVDDPVPPNLLMYCFAPCEEQRRYKMVVNMDMVNGGCEMCPICKHRNSPIGKSVKEE